MRNILLLLTLFTLQMGCSKKDISSEENYSIKIHYQSVIFKINGGRTFDVYVENFLNIKNNTVDTLIIPHKKVKDNLKLVYKDISMPILFMSTNDIKIAPLDSIDLNCAVNVKDDVADIPLKANMKDYMIYNKSNKKYLLYNTDYEIIRSTRFGVFKEKYLQ